MIRFWGIFLPIRKRKQPSNTPTPLGAVGTIKPIVQEKQKATNKKIISRFFSTLIILMQIKNPINFVMIKLISNNKALAGKKEIKFIFFAKFEFEFEMFKASKAFPLKDVNFLSTK